MEEKERLVDFGWTLFIINDGLIHLFEQLNKNLL